MSKKDEVFRRYEKLAKAEREKIPGVHQSINPEAALTASTIARISSIAGASSPGVPTVRIRMCFARSL